MSTMRPQRRRSAELQIVPPEFSKASFAYETLRREILNGSYRPGERLRLSQIAQQLALSEMPVREALRLLQKDGLVVMELHRGAHVAALSLKRAHEIVEVRTALECVAGFTALPLHDAPSVIRLERSLARLEAARRDARQFARRNRELLTLLYARAPNEFLRQHIQALWDQVWRFSSTLLFEFMPGRLEATILENRAIVAAISDRDGVALQALLARRRDDILAGWQRAIECETPPS
ncbi:MAG TPA: GntR family transcriptional regulator [Vicinamibacterales bacterium]